MSSWSTPIMLAPLRASRPRTVNEAFWMRTSLPTGDCSPNSSRAVVWPIRQTRLPLRTWLSSSGLPSARDHSRTSMMRGVVP